MATFGYTNDIPTFYGNYCYINDGNIVTYVDPVIQLKGSTYLLPRITDGTTGDITCTLPYITNKTCYLLGMTGNVWSTKVKNAFKAVACTNKYTSVTAARSSTMPLIVSSGWYFGVYSGKITQSFSSTGSFTVTIQDPSASSQSIKSVLLTAGNYVGSSYDNVDPFVRSATKSGSTVTVNYGFTNSPPSSSSFDLFYMIFTGY